MIINNQITTAINVILAILILYELASVSFNIIRYTGVLKDIELKHLAAIASIEVISYYSFLWMVYINNDKALAILQELIITLGIIIFFYMTNAFIKEWRQKT